MAVAFDHSQGHHCPALTCPAVITPHPAARRTGHNTGLMTSRRPVRHVTRKLGSGTGAALDICRSFSNDSLIRCLSCAYGQQKQSNTVGDASHRQPGIPQTKMFIMESELPPGNIRSRGRLRPAKLHVVTKRDNRQDVEPTTATICVFDCGLKWSRSAT